MRGFIKLNLDTRKMYLKSYNYLQSLPVNILADICVNLNVCNRVDDQVAKL